MRRHNLSSSQHKREESQHCHNRAVMRVTAQAQRRGARPSMRPTVVEAATNMPNRFEPPVAHMWPSGTQNRDSQINNRNPDTSHGARMKCLRRNLSRRSVRASGTMMQGVCLGGRFARKDFAYFGILGLAYGGILESVLG